MHALETAVFIELTRRGEQVAYVKTRDGYEVDFLAQHPDGRQELFQVCADVTGPANWHRENDETPQDACAARAPVAVGRRLRYRRGSADSGPLQGGPTSNAEELQNPLLLNKGGIAPACNYLPHTYLRILSIAVRKCGRPTRAIISE